MLQDGVLCRGRRCVVCNHWEFFGNDFHARIHIQMYLRAK